MRVNDKVRRKAAFGKGHVFLVGNKADDPLLPMAGCKLVTDFRYPQVTGPHLDEA